MYRQRETDYQELNLKSFSAKDITLKLNPDEKIILTHKEADGKQFINLEIPGCGCYLLEKSYKKESAQKEFEKISQTLEGPCTLKLSYGNSLKIT